MSRADDHDLLRVPPFNVEAEQSVLGGLMLDQRTFDLISDSLSESDFYRREHRLVYRSIVELAGKGKPFDSVTMGEYLEAHGLADQVGPGYLIELSSETPSAANVRAYAAIVRDLALRRRLIEVGTDIVAKGFDERATPAVDLVGQATSSLGAILSSEPSELETMGDVIGQMIDEQARRAAHSGEIDGLSTGYPDLDRELCGMKPGQVIIIGGRPKMGKTTLAMNILEHVAVVQNQAAADHSLEMSPVSLVERMCCSIGRVPHNAVRWADMTDEQSTNFHRAAAMIKKAPIVMSKPRGTKVDQLIAQTKRMHAKKPLKLVVIDYLQLIEVNDRDNRAAAIGDISRKLKMMAVTLGIVVILLSQLNRKLEERPNKRPVLSDLRDSGSIEQDADVVLFIYRDEVYSPNTPDKGTAEIIIAAQRSGPPGMVRLRSRLDLCRFDTLEDDWHPDAPMQRPTKASERFKKPSGREAATGDPRDD